MNVFQLYLPLPDKQGVVSFRVETAVPIPSGFYSGALYDASRKVIELAEALGWQDQPATTEGGDQ